MNIPIYSLDRVSPTLEQAFGAAMLTIARNAGHRDKLPANPNSNKPAPMQDRVIGVIRRHGPVSVSGIARMTKSSRPSVRNMVSVLTARGDLKVVSGGRYSRYALAHEKI